MEAIKGKRKQPAYRELLRNILESLPSSSSPRLDVKSSSALSTPRTLGTSSTGELRPSTVPGNASYLIESSGYYGPDGASPHATSSEFILSLKNISENGGTPVILVDLISKVLSEPSRALDLVDEYLSPLFPIPTTRPTHPKSNLIRKSHSRPHRIKEYARIQNLYRKDRTKAARLILDGENADSAVPSEEDIRNTIGALFSSDSPPDEVELGDVKSACSFYYTVSMAETKEALKDSSKSSPGPD